MKIAVFADIHIGTNPNTNKTYEEIKMNLMVAIEQDVEMIQFVGDWFDHRMYLDSDQVILMIELLEYMYEECSKRKIAVRFISGTGSHDHGQYAFMNSYLFRRDFNLRIMTSVSEERYKDHDILYIPEEVISDKHEYYKDTLYSKKYDYIFGHGAIVEGMPMVKHDNQKELQISTPRFTTGELENACNKLCCFGHYHVHWKLGKVMYVGSLTRWKFGEPAPKGFVFIDDSDWIFMKNLDCDIFLQYNLNVVNMDEPEDIYGELNAIISDYKEKDKHSYGLVAKVKIKVEIAMGVLAQQKLNIIRSYCNDEKITIEPIYTELIDEEQDEVVSEEDKPLNWLFDKEIPMYQKIVKFTEYKKGVTLNPEKIKKYL
jgi:DNA repair exonuclease SbcCD nuclease subunit